MKKLFLLFLLTLSVSMQAEQTLPATTQDVPQAPSITELTPEEQLGQTLTVFVDVDSAELFRPVIESGQVGNVLIQWGNYSLEQTRQLIKRLQSWAAKSPHHIPLLVAIDYEGGTVYTPITLGFDYLPTNMMLAAANDEELTASVAYLAGQELKRAGVHINFSPVLDVNNNPNNPIIGVRSFGSNPALVTKMGLSLIDGFQAAGIISTVKHFPGHGDTSVDSHYAVPVVQSPLQELQRVHIAPFEQAISHGVRGIMTSHILYPALDNKEIATFSKPIVQDLLQHKLGFSGLVVTDSLDMKSATSFCTIADCAARALLSGSDLILLGRYIKPRTTVRRIAEQMQQNPALQKRVQESAQKILQLKEELGLFHSPQNTPLPLDLAYREKLAQISRKAVTLVRDRDHLIPYTLPADLNREPIVCALFFAPSRFADQLMPFSKPFLEKGWTVRTYNAALTPKALDAKRAKQCADGADLLVISSLQWADKTNLNQKDIIQYFLRRHPATIFISTMSPYDIAHYPTVPTILATYGLNKHVLETAANIILGNQEPLGHLPIRLPNPETTSH